MESSRREGALLDLNVGNEAGKVAEVLVCEHFGDSDHDSICFQVVMEKHEDDLQVRVVNCGRANFNHIRQDLTKVEC